MGATSSPRGRTALSQASPRQSSGDDRIVPHPFCAGAPQNLRMHKTSCNTKPKLQHTCKLKITLTL